MDNRGFSGLTSLASEREGHRTGAQAEADDKSQGGEKESASKKPPRTATRQHPRDDDSNTPLGFAGLPSLSGIATTAGPQHQDDSPGREKPKTQSGEPSSMRRTAAARKPDAEKREPMVSRSPRATKKRSSFAKWAVIAGIAIAAVYAFNIREIHDEVLAAIGAATDESASSATAASPPPPKAPSKLKFSKPPVGRDNVLNTAQIRWCLRESITIESLRSRATSNLRITEFNGLIADYNNRCGSYRYRRGALERARREVELMREEIRHEALARWHQSAMPSSPAHLFGARSARTSLQEQTDTPTSFPAALVASTSRPSLIVPTGGISVPSDAYLQELLDEGIELPRAWGMVAEAYERGDELPKDPVLARFFYWNAAREGDARAQLTMAVMVMEGGHGFPQDDSEAARWTRLAAEQGDRDGQFLLCYLYALGIGVPTSELEAARWYRLAAEQGHEEAQVALGHMYFEGAGVPEDFVSAYAWWSIAASQGHEEARKSKAYMAEHMTKPQISKAQDLSQEFWQLYVLPFQ